MADMGSMSGKLPTSIPCLHGIKTETKVIQSKRSPELEMDINWTTGWGFP